MTKLPRMRRDLFEGLLEPHVRKELADSFRQANREPRTFAGTAIDGVIGVRPEERNTAEERERDRTRGVSRFSSPAYSADGHALVYASYVCGGLCGYGWLFLLESDGGSWRVVSAHMLWIS